MKVLVTGAGGQVGRALVRLGTERSVVGLGRADLDITDRDAVACVFETHAPDVVINAAAYTAVDRAEEEPDRAFAVNRDGVQHLAEASADAGTLLIHLSTDYVFDGTKGAPYVEDDAPNPVNVYGTSKLAGEEAVRSALDQHVILRTSWVFSEHAPNFVRTILRLAEEREELRVVADQRGCPTAAVDVARAALRIADAWGAGERHTGTFHLAGSPATTWYGLAEAVVAEAKRHGPIRVARAEPIPTSAYPTPAPRPPDGRLDTSRIAAIWGIEAADWRPEVARVVAACGGS